MVKFEVILCEAVEWAIFNDKSIDLANDISRIEDE